MKASMPYLVFSGNCREALEFYADCLDGEIISIQTVAESPLQAEGEHQNRIFDSEFRAENFRFKASDDMPGHEVNAGTNFSIFLAFDDSAKQEKIFKKLSRDGHIQFPLENNFGMLTDKYKVQWMLALH